MSQGHDDADRPPQGWFVDPFGIHEQRWISQGNPTALVRDGRVEAQDAPPDLAVTGPLVPAKPPPRQGAPSDDLLRAGDRAGTGGDPPDEIPGDQFDFFGDPAIGGTMGMSPALPMSAVAGSLAINPMDLGGPTTPRRIVRARWIALGGALVWTALITVQLLSATTTVRTGGGHLRTESVAAADPWSVLVFSGFLVVACAVCGVGLVRRIRSGSEAWSRSGCVCTAVVAVLGVLSLATVGLTLLVLAALLFVISRPMRRPRPIIGERVPSAG
jgi:hypothetical protein